MIILKHNKYFTLFSACIALFFVSFIFSREAYAVTVSTLNLQTMLENLSTQVPQLMKFITALAYVLGMYFIVMGVMKLKHYGESRTQMSSEHSLKGPLIYFAVGAALLYLPTSVAVGLGTFWSTPTPYAYETTNAEQWSGFIRDCFLIVQLIGTISFIRGLIILSHLGGQSGQQGTFGKGMTHIVAGILCINIYQFVQVIMATFGIQVA